MDFAKKQLEKYGWKEGQGLGKDENGISVALKPKLKLDNYGIGHDSAQEFTNNWWENLYNQACSNLNVKNDESVNIDVKDPDSVEITTKSYSIKNIKAGKSGLEYGSFLKTSKLTASGVVSLGNNFQVETSRYNTCNLTDEQLFAACGNRTVHKGARHGIGLNGKLSRIEKQEKLLLKQLKRASLSDETNSKLEKKLKKIAEHKTRSVLDTVEDDTIVLDLPSGNQCLLGSPSSHKSKKRKKERRRVSFNETVTEYQTQTDDETNLNSNTNLTPPSDSNSQPSTPVTVRLVRIREREVDNNGNISSQDQDEGIDCINYDVSRGNLSEKVKKENKKMKRKLKKMRSLAAIRECTNNHMETSCTKRKLFNDNEDCDDIEVQLKKFHLDGSSKHGHKKCRKQRRMERRVNKVADSLDQFCKI